MRLLMIVAGAVLLAGLVSLPAAAQDGAMAHYEAAMEQAEAELDRDRERRAANHLDEAEAALSEAGGDRPLERGRIAVLRAGVERERRDWDDAFAHIDRAAGLLERGGADPREYGDTQYTRGFIAYQAEEYAAAEDAFEAAVTAYRTGRDQTDSRRLRANGWYALAAHRNQAFGHANENYVYGQAYFSANVGPYPDPELAALYPLGEWSEPMQIQLPYTAFVGRRHGFAVARYDLDRNGRPANIEILASYPGHIFDNAVKDTLRTGRRVAGDVGPQGHVTLFTFIVER